VAAAGDLDDRAAGDEGVETFDGHVEAVPGRRRLAPHPDLH
jgi:hypothetical protein